MSGRWSAASERGGLVFAPAAAVAGTHGRPAAFLDRDGVLNEGVPDPVSGELESPLQVSDVRLLQGAAEAARQLASAGYVLVCVTNQPAAAKAKTTLASLKAVHERVVELLARQGVQLAGSHLCLHHPQAVVPELAGPCDCRKPAPGMLLDAAEALGLHRASSWMLGDTDPDVLAGQAAGCKTVLIGYPGSAHKRLGRVSPDLLASSLADGVAQLLDHDGG